MQKNMQNMHCSLDQFANSSCASIGFNDISTENQAVSKRTHAQSSSSRGDSSCWDHSRGTTTLPTRSVLRQIRFLLLKKHNMSNMQNITKKLDWYTKSSTWLCVHSSWNWVSQTNSRRRIQCHFRVLPSQLSSVPPAGEATAGGCWCGGHRAPGLGGGLRARFLD